MKELGKNNRRGGGDYRIAMSEIRHLRELMDERDKALKLQAKVDELKTDGLRKDIEDIKGAGYVTKAFLWTAIVALAGFVYFVLNYFKK